MVFDIPRFRITGVSTRANSFSRSKFCMFRAPILSTSTSPEAGSTSRTSMISVSTSTPVPSRMRARISRPSRPSPWKEYGEVRGL